MATSYQMMDAAEFERHVHDVISLLYHRKSGITHILVDPMPQILDIMGQDILSPAEIEERLHKRYAMRQDEVPGSEESAEFIDIITARLEEFVALGLMLKK